MKFAILSFAAPMALGSLTVTAMENFLQTQGTSLPGLFDYFAPASTSVPGVSQLCQGDCQNDNGDNAPQTSAFSYVSVQCQGDCQNDGAAAPNTADNADQQGIRGLVRQFIGSVQTQPAVNQETGHLVIYNTPVYDMVYNFMFSQEAESAEPTQVNRFASQEVAGDNVSAFSAVASSSTAYLQDVFTFSRVVAPEDDEVDGMMDFDFSSWGKRVDNAAQRLVSNVEAVIVRYLSATKELSTPTASVEEYAGQTDGVYEDYASSKAAAADRFQWF
ncbi:hypothetical protein J3B02_000461 [Coemansia erecta]|nr:hypothetical protein J3B02_000461 [Coemansia erecta]